MSEYQYYEFQAIDRALTEQEQAEVAKLSSRVNLSPHRAVFTYSYGDFRGDPVKLLTRCFDAMLYLANWGSSWLYFRFPRKLVAPEKLAPYCVDDCISTSTSGDHVVLGIHFDEEEGRGWIEGEGDLSPMLPLRQQILEGDYRALYLAWLKAVQFADEDEGKQSEPPVPPGLHALSKPLKAFVEFFDVDADLLAVAAKASSDTAPEADLEPWLHCLSDVERLELLRSLLRDEPGVSAQLRLRLREIANRQKPSAPEQKSKPPRRVSVLLQSAEKAANERAQQAKRELEDARVRKLAELAQKETQLWAQVNALIAQKQIKAYDEAVGILKELRELAEHRGQVSGFDSRIREIQQRYPSLSGLRWRLEEAGLVSKRA